MTNKFKIEKFTIRECIKFNFIIPCYQRPYAWQAEQINTLFDDIEKSLTKQNHLYLGGIITSDDRNRVELVDGQQHLTTLWLILYVLGDCQLNLSFEIRDNLNQFFKNKDKNILKDLSDDNIKNALDIINHKLKTFNDKEKLKDFIYNNIILIKNTCPENMELEKLFVTLNNTGRQLEKTDILKAKLLAKLNKNSEEIQKYAEYWEKCEKMDQLITKQDPDTDSQPDEPILNFAQLLLHTYRLFLCQHQKDDFNIPLDTKHLLEIFSYLTNSNDENKIKAFFDLLWHVREIFDRHIICWITNENDERILSIRQYNDNQCQDTKSLVMLQSVLYFTDDSNTRYWLTPYLGKLIQQQEKQENFDNLAFLEQLDNRLSLPRLFGNNDNKETQKSLSWDILNGKDIAINQQQIENIQQYLMQNKGAGFAHYIFQKLEYILWKNPNAKSNIENYRITAKNSIEHIYPQTPKDNQLLNEQYLHSFGNLTLLTQSRNSSYTNDDFSDKKHKYEQHLKQYGKPESLKSSYIFCYEKWGEEEIAQHQKSMIDKIIQYYQQSR